MLTRASVAFLVLAIGVGAQDEREVAEFLKQRAQVDAFKREGASWVRAVVDGKTLCEIAGKTGKLDVIREKTLASTRFLVLTVDDEEVLRLWVRSLAKPVDTAPTAPGEFAHAGMSGSGVTVAVRLVTKTGLGEVLFEAKGVEPRAVKCEIRGRSRVVLLGDVVVYRIPATPSPPSKPLESERQEAGQQATPEELRKAVLKRVNHFRKIVGVDPVTEDPVLSVGCQRHAEYLRKNIDNPAIRDEGMHRELKELAGYSEEGNKSARQSLVHSWSNSQPIDDGIDAFIATLYHRIPLLDARLTAIGIGMLVDEWKVLVVNASKTDLKVNLRTHPVIYPVCDQKEVPTTFSRGLGEWPDPRPDPKLQGGYPVTVQFAEMGWQPNEVRVTLIQGGQQVQAWLSTPQTPALEDRPQRGVVCIIPKAPLAPSTTYTVSMECKQIGVEKTPIWTKTWSFTTTAADSPKDKEKEPKQREK